MATKVKKSMKPKRPRQWSVLRVDSNRSGTWFLHGRRQLKELSASIFDKGTEFQIFRSKIIFDTGNVEELGGHNNGDTRFIGFVQTAPLSERHQYGSGIYMNSIKSNWFKASDVIRVAMSARSLRERLDTFCK